MCFHNYHKCFQVFLPLTKFTYVFGKLLSETSLEPCHSISDVWQDSKYSSKSRKAVQPVNGCFGTTSVTEVYFVSCQTSMKPKQLTTKICQLICKTFHYGCLTNPAGIHLLKVDNRNTDVKSAQRKQRRLMLFCCLYC